MQTAPVSGGSYPCPCALTEIRQTLINNQNRWNVADSKGHDGRIFKVGTTQPTFLRQVLSCLAPPLSTLRMLRPACSPVQCTAIFPSAAVFPWATRFRSALVLSRSSASSIQFRPVCLFPSRLFWTARPWWRRAAFGKRKQSTWFQLWGFVLAREDELMHSRARYVHCKMKLQWITLNELCACMPTG